jgi:hypothetical protein
MGEIRKKKLKKQRPTFKLGVLKINLFQWQLACAFAYPHI